MKILVTGYSGQLGFDVVRELRKHNIECIGTTRQDFDITDFAATREFIHNYQPDVVIHCSAYTAVDKAEDDVDNCRLVNAAAVRNIAEECSQLKAKLVYISTDYVFPGDGDNFYEPVDKTAPLGIYGQTKLEGEQAVQAVLDEYFIVRISWVFGSNGNNFIKTMLRLAETRDKLTVVGDQLGSPAYTVDLAKLLVDMVQTDKYGIYHAANEGICSWAEFAQEIFRQAGKNVAVTPIPSADYPTRAVRPHNSRLSKECLVKNGFAKLPDWQDALHRFLIEIKAI